MNSCGIALKPNDIIITMIGIMSMRDHATYDLAIYDAISLPNGISDTFSVWHSAKFISTRRLTVQIVVLDREIVAFVCREIELRL